MTPQLFTVHVWNSEDTLALQDFYVGLCACVRARSCMPGMLVSHSQGSRRGLWWLVLCQGCTYLLTYLCESRIYVPRQMRERAFRSKSQGDGPKSQSKVTLTRLINAVATTGQH